MTHHLDGVWTQIVSTPGSWL